jgi:hypothetical protein
MAELAVLFQAKKRLAISFWLLAKSQKPKAKSRFSV